MKLVLDATVALCWILTRPHTPNALCPRHAYRNQVHELIAPDHFPAEVASALTESERQRILAVGQARRRDFGGPSGRGSESG